EPLRHRLPAGVRSIAGDRRGLDFGLGVGVVTGRVLCGLLAMLAAGTGDAPADAELLRQAETAFQAGVAASNANEAEKSFRAAAERYEELSRRGYRNADLFR